MMKMRFLGICEMGASCYEQVEGKSGRKTKESIKEKKIIKAR
jgi:hypothetical protein